MNNNWHDYLADRGLNNALIEEYLAYINRLEENSIPVIFENEHLSRLLGIKYPEFNKLIFGTHKFYRKFKIPKRKGGYRIIASPYPSLFSCQKWIYNNILKKIPTHVCAQAYKKDHSIIKNANLHLNNDVMLKMDINNFFSEIPINWVIKLFSDLGYSKNVSFALASLCCLDGVLPQGGVTSPALSNILMLSLDNRLHKLAEKFDLIYTRYADDMFFSGKKISSKLINYIKNIVEEYNLSINESKTKLLTKEKRKIVTGIDTSSSKLTLPRATRRNIKKSMHFIIKYGLIGHMNNVKIKNPNYLLSLEGKIRFWIQVEPENQEALYFLNEILKIKKLS
ncbi:retron St85 family RNA-directed DNA polymerase [Pectobacterium actinidiae]|uniref:retron St85 family RNA-directed DNA polymerase n=1 Tax=Pectobacterium actinidiae TaxID=1507808 RepID=UPI003808C0A6